MLLSISWLEWVGYLSSVIVAISLMMSSIVRLRWYNLIGALIFSFYGFMIGSLPVGLLNLFIVVTNIYYLRGIYSKKESFKALPTHIDDPYLRYYLDFYKKDIVKFFPDLDKIIKEMSPSKDTWVLLLLRNAQLAGILVGKRNGPGLNILIDYVTASYRDMKTGAFLYQHSDIFEKEGIELLIQETNKPMQQKFLRNMGFTEHPAGRFELFLK